MTHFREMRRLIASTAIVLMAGVACGTLIFLGDRISVLAWGAPLEAGGLVTTFFGIALVGFGLGKAGKPQSLWILLPVTISAATGVAIGTSLSVDYSLAHEGVDRNLWPFEVLLLWVFALPWHAAWFGLGRR